MKNQYLTADSIRSHTIQFKAIKDMKDNKDSPSGLPKLLKSTEPLAWMDRVHKTLRNLIGQDHTPLRYLICDDPTVPVTTDDLITNKCYSKTHKSLIGELVTRKSHDSSCVEVHKVVLYNHLDKALQNGPLESALQANEDTKDGQAVMKIIMLQHGKKRKIGKIACVIDPEPVYMLEEYWEYYINRIYCQVSRKCRNDCLYL